MPIPWWLCRRSRSSGGLISSTISVERIHSMGSEEYGGSLASCEVWFSRGRCIVSRGYLVYRISTASGGY